MYRSTNIIENWVFNGKTYLSIYLSICILSVCSNLCYAGTRSDYELIRQEQKIKEQNRLMKDLDIPIPPETNRNEVGPYNHFIERTESDELIIYSHPKYYYAKDGKLAEANIQLKPSDRNDSDYQMETAVYRFYGSNDASFMVFHYGMWMYYSLSHVAYHDKSTGLIHLIEWNRVPSTPKVTENSMVWDEVFPGIGLEIVLIEDMIKETIFLNQTARESLPDPKLFGLDPLNTDIVFLTEFVMGDLSLEDPESDHYKIADGNGERSALSSFAFDGDLQFMRDGKVRPY